MTDTIRIPILVDDWTQINTGLVGTVSNFNEQDIHLRETPTKPNASVVGGHKLRPGGEIPFSLEQGNSLWARSRNTDTNVFVSIGINPIMDTVIRDNWLASFEQSSSGTTELKVNIKNLQKTAFGDLSVESLRPIHQKSAEYGLLDQVLTVVDDDSSGSNSIVNNKFTCQTGTAADGLASILSLRQLKYRSGQGALARFTAVFSAGVADSQQAAGLITAENSFVFAFFGDCFRYSPCS